MGVVTTKSTAITNRDATPRVLNDPQRIAKPIQEWSALVAVASGESVGSKKIVGSVPSNARVSELLATSADIGTTTAGDIGLYDTTENGGAVVDVDYFASAVSFNGGAIDHSDVTHEAGAAGGLYTNDEKMVWEVLGLSADPQKEYDVVVTLTGAADAAGTIGMKCRYTQ